MLKIHTSQEVLNLAKTWKVLNQHQGIASRIFLNFYSLNISIVSKWNLGVDFEIQSSSPKKSKLAGHRAKTAIKKGDNLSINSYVQKVDWVQYKNVSETEGRVSNRCATSQVSRWRSYHHRLCSAYWFKEVLTYSRKLPSWFYCTDVTHQPFL